MTLRYIDTQGGSLPGVPARDLTDEEAAAFDAAQLIASGLYKQDETRSADRAKKAAAEEDQP